MLDLIETWFDGICYLFEEELVSFYAYFTTILTEIVILWRFFPQDALPFTILLCACIVNVVVCAFFKGKYEGTKVELVFARVYLIVFGIILAVGFFFGWLKNIILFLVPVIVSFVWVLARLFQILMEDAVIKEGCSKVFSSDIFRSVIQVIITLVPLEAFALFVYLTSITSEIKIAIIFGYVALIPFIVYMEDILAASNIFELAYYLTWSKEQEKQIEENTKLFQENPSQGFNELFSEMNAIESALKELDKYD